MRRERDSHLLEHHLNVKINIYKSSGMVGIRYDDQISFGFQYTVHLVDELDIQVVRLKIF